MIIEIIPHVGAAPLSLPITQFVVRQDNGTVIAAGAEHGPQGTQAISMVGMEDFARILTILGIDKTIVHNLRLPKPRPPIQLEQGGDEYGEG